MEELFKPKFEISFNLESRKIHVNESRMKLLSIDNDGVMTCINKKTVFIAENYQEANFIISLRLKGVEIKQ